MSMSNYKLTEEELEEYNKLVDQWRKLYVSNVGLINDYPMDGKYHPGVDQKCIIIQKILDNRLIRTDEKQDSAPQSEIAPLFNPLGEAQPLGFRRLFDKNKLGGKTWRPSEREFNPFQGSGIEAFVDDTGTITLKKVFNGIGFITPAGQVMGVCMRDGGYEINFGGKWYRANDGKIEPLNQEESDFADHISTSFNPDPVWISKEQDKHIKVAEKLIIALKHDGGALNRQEVRDWKKLVEPNELYAFIPLVAAFHKEIGECLDDDQINELVEAPEEELRKKYQGEAFDNLYLVMNAYFEML